MKRDEKVRSARLAARYFQGSRLKEVTSRTDLSNLNCNCLEIGYFQGAKETLVHCQSRIKTVDHWHDDTTREAFVPEAKGEANFVQTASRRSHHASPKGDFRPL